MENWLLNDPIGFMVLGWLRNVVYGVTAAIFLSVLFERLFTKMNKAIGVNFKDHVWDKIKDDPAAMADYFGKRIMGALIACGIFAAYFLK